jgi:hypothetical protein
MSQRKRFDLEPFAEMIFEVEGERFPYTHLYQYAVIGITAAGIEETVFKTENGQFIFTVCAADDGEDRNPSGMHHGWYVAYFITSKEADEYRRSWSILREQPPEPTGLWA